MSGTTMMIQGNFIIINLEKIEEDVFHDADKQTVVFLAKHLGGFNINYSNRTITLYLTLEGISSYNIDFDRGGIDSRISQINFDNAIKILTVSA
jgi:hypothetical protein